MAETRPKLVDTIGEELKNAINDEIIKIQADAHQRLQNAMRNAIHSLGFGFEYRETHTLGKDLTCSITFSVPIYKLKGKENE